MFVAEEPGPLEHVVRFRRALAGAETNVATGLARLGHRVGWVGRVGDDPFGRFALTELAAAGVDTDPVTLDSDAPTGFQLKSRADGGDPEVVYFRRNSAGSRLAPGPGRRLRRRRAAPARHRHPAGPVGQRPGLRLPRGRRGPGRGATISFDPNLRPTLWASPQEMVRGQRDGRAGRLGAARAREGHLLTGPKDPTASPRSTWSGAPRVSFKNGGAGASAHTAEGRVDRRSSPCRSSTRSGPATVSRPG